MTIPAIEKQINILRNEIISSYGIKSPTVTSGVNAAYNGKITPDFLPPAEITAKILTQDDMRGSIYQSDPTLVYQLGKFMLMSMQHQPFSVSGLLILPRLLKEYVGIVLSVNRVPIHRAGDQEAVILDYGDLAVREISFHLLMTTDKRHTDANFYNALRTKLGWLIF